MEDFIPDLVEEIRDDNVETTKKEYVYERTDTVPVTILTGFLGAGKSTLLSHLLMNNEGKKICVVQNEYGEKIGIEEEAINRKLVYKLSDKSETTAGNSEDQRRNVLDWIELSNGCVCCSARSELVLALEAIVQQTKEGKHFDHILIECDGLSKVGKVIGSVWLDEGLDSFLVLDGVVAVIDCSKFLNKRLQSYMEEIYHQISFADRVILNKQDLCPEKTVVAEIKEKILAVNPDVEICFSSYSKVETKWVLDIGGFSRTAALKSMEHKHVGVHKNHDDDHGKAHAVVASKRGDLDEIKLQKWIGSLVWQEEVDKSGTLQASHHSDQEKRNYQPEIVRIKGVVCLSGQKTKQTLQGVCEWFELQDTLIPWNDEPHESKIVFIGRNLDQVQLQTGLEECEH